MQTNLKIENLQVASKEPEMMAECITKAIQYTDSNVIVTPFLRKSTGWLEWTIVVESHNSPRRFVMGAIQRTVNGTFEFHS
jgi:hypothetical protein